MPTYTFRCPDCGPLTASFAMSDVPAVADCACGAAARRLITAPHIGLGNATARRLLDATSATADRPVVTNSVPPNGSGRRATATRADPRQAHLPRP